MRNPGDPADRWLRGDDEGPDPDFIPTRYFLPGGDPASKECQDWLRELEQSESQADRDQAAWTRAHYGL